jgi:hypothetical protein
MKTIQVHSGDRNNKKLLNVPDSVPYEILNEEWAQRNHSQTLTRLNERGGLCVLEMLNNIDKKRLDFRGATQSEVDRLNEIVYEFLNKLKKGD